ncbi:MAG: cell division protein FtsQ/DivIB [Candidatus Limnocylindrales bacterium]
MSTRAPVRRAGGHAARRGPTIRRASAGLSPIRAGAFLVMLLTAAAMYGLVASDAFAFKRVELDGAHFTSESAVRTALALGDGTNLVRLRTDGLAAALRQLPTVKDADVSVALPGTVRVQLDERVPILIWQTDAGSYLVDDQGVLFALADASPTDAVDGLPVLADHREAATELHVGATLDPVDLDAATRLGSIVPADLGSTATSLSISVDDDNGYVMKSVPDGWSATFGYYTPSQRQPTLVPDQVRALRSVLAQVGEAKLATIILAGDHNGTYTTRDGR